MSEYLLSKDYEVHGLIRRSSNYSTKNIDHILNKITLHYGDMQNEHHLCSVIHDLAPDEIYNLAAQSDVGISFEMPEYTCDIGGLGVVRLLESARKFSPNSKIYLAGTSEQFGNSTPPQNELTPMNPRNPYACGKLFSYNMGRVYREAYGMYVCTGILFNHESPRRGPNFVTRKISIAVNEIAKGRAKSLKLGNLDAKRDWGYSSEYVTIMHKMLQQDNPDDFVIGTGEVHTVKEFAEEAFRLVGLSAYNYLEVDMNLYRPAETNFLCADISKAKEKLGWEPKVKFKELVKIMVENDSI